MMLTYNVKHDLDLNREMGMARAVAELGVKYGYSSSKQVKHIGLKSKLSNAILRKYGKCRTIKEVHNIVIPINNQAFRWDGKVIYIPCLKARIPFEKEGIIRVAYD